MRDREDATERVLSELRDRPDRIEMMEAADPSSTDDHIAIVLPEDPVAHVFDMFDDLEVDEVFVATFSRNGRIAMLYAVVDDPHVDPGDVWEAHEESPVGMLLDALRAGGGAIGVRCGEDDEMSLRVIF